MANQINHAETYENELLEIFADNSYIAPFIANNVKWLDAKTFHFTSMQVGGYKNHKLEGGWNRQSIEQKDHPYTVEQDRDVEFFVDKREVDESNRTASVQNISNTFEKTQATPEKDAYFFSKVATEAGKVGLKTSTALSAYTAENVYSKLVEQIGKVKRYRGKGLLGYVRSEIMDLLALSKELSKSIEVATLTTGEGRAVETRITKINGVVLVEVIDDDRFYSAYDLTDGYIPANGSFHINTIFATPMTTKFVPKIASIYMFAPGEHTQGDGYLYQNRAHYDAFLFPNGKDGVVDSVFVDLDTTTFSA